MLRGYARATERWAYVWQLQDKTTNLVAELPTLHGFRSAGGYRGQVARPLIGRDAFRK